MAIPLDVPSRVAPRFWTAVAERSGDTAFGRTQTNLNPIIFRPHEGGVALRFPPQSINYQSGDTSKSSGSFNWSVLNW